MLQYRFVIYLFNFQSFFPFCTVSMWSKCFLQQYWYNYCYELQLSLLCRNFGKYFIFCSIHILKWACFRLYTALLKTRFKIMISVFITAPCVPYPCVARGFDLYYIVFMTSNCYPKYLFHFSVIYIYNYSTSTCMFHTFCYLKIWKMFLPTSSNEVVTRKKSFIRFFLNFRN